MPLSCSNLVIQRLPTFSPSPERAVRAPCGEPHPGLADAARRSRLTDSRLARLGAGQRSSIYRRHPHRRRPHTAAHPRWPASSASYKTWPGSRWGASPIRPRKQTACFSWGG